jgi:hypothetical protein
MLCIVDSAAIYIMVVKFRNTICPPPPQLSLHMRAALSSNSNGTQSVYSLKNPKSSRYYEMSMNATHVKQHAACVFDHLATLIAIRPPACGGGGGAAKEGETFQNFITGSLHFSAYVSKKRCRSNL